MVLSEARNLLSFLRKVTWRDFSGRCTAFQTRRGVAGARFRPDSNPTAHNRRPDSANVFRRIRRFLGSIACTNCMYTVLTWPSVYSTGHQSRRLRSGMDSCKHNPHRFGPVPNIGLASESSYTRSQIHC